MPVIAARSSQQPTSTYTRCAIEETASLHTTTTRLQIARCATCTPPSKPTYTLVTTTLSIRSTSTDPSPIVQIRDSTSSGIPPTTVGGIFIGVFFGVVILGGLLFFCISAVWSYQSQSPHESLRSHSRVGARQPYMPPRPHSPNEPLRPESPFRPVHSPMSFEAELHQPHDEGPQLSSFVFFGGGGTDPRTTVAKGGFKRKRRKLPKRPVEPVEIVPPPRSWPRRYHTMVADQHYIRTRNVEGRRASYFG